jgi:hypothetical protein
MIEWLDLETGMIFTSWYFDALFFSLAKANWSRFAILGYI